MPTRNAKTFEESPSIEIEKMSTKSAKTFEELFSVNIEETANGDEDLYLETLNAEIEQVMIHGIYNTKLMEDIINIYALNVVEKQEKALAEKDREILKEIEELEEEIEEFSIVVITNQIKLLHKEIKLFELKNKNIEKKTKQDEKPCRITYNEKIIQTYNQELIEINKEIEKILKEEKENGFLDGDEKEELNSWLEQKEDLLLDKERAEKEVENWKAKQENKDIKASINSFLLEKEKNYEEINKKKLEIKELEEKRMKIKKEIEEKQKRMKIKKEIEEKQKRNEFKKKIEDWDSEKKELFERAIFVLYSDTFQDYLMKKIDRRLIITGYKKPSIPETLRTSLSDSSSDDSVTRNTPNSLSGIKNQNKGNSR